MAIVYKPESMNKIGCIKKENATQSTGLVEEFIVCTIKCDLIKINLKIYQPRIITKMTQGLNYD